ncbi:MAG: HlyD family efflux transporter periplasmic adaptor subunit [Myxococcales bacterium]|nr:HlyD family efflux transporter periplasmic adaptor subunit [Myxococcales bacterium]
MTMMIPRLRGDLKATPVEDNDGVLYYDISDPKTGGSLRLFDFEWLLAQRLDGQQNYAELARWTEEQLGFSTSTGDLEAYGGKLLELGMAESVAAPAPRPEVAEPTKPAVAEPSKPAISEPVRPKAEPARAASDDGDDVMGRPVISLPTSRPAAKPATQPEVKAVPAAKPVEPAALPEPPPAKPAEAPAPAAEVKPAVAVPSAVEKPAEPSKPTPPPALSGSPTAQLEPVPTPPTDTKTVPLATVAPPSAKTPVTPEKPVETKPTEVAPSAKTPVGKTPATEQPQGGGAGKWLVLLLVLAAAIGAAYYFLVYVPKMHPPAISVRMSEAKPESMPRKFPAPAIVKSADPLTLKIEADGEVSKVAAEKDEVTPETVLVELNSKAKLEKELADLRKQLPPLQKKAETGKGKAKADAQTKLDEKQKRIGEVEGLIKKASLSAPRPGTVAKVLVKPGQAVTAGTDVIAISEKALAAELTMPAMEAQSLKVGDEVKLLADGTPMTAHVHVLKTEGDQATVQFILPADSKAKDGDKLSLQRGMLEQVVRLPSAALVEGGKVYVAREGKASLKAVTVADRDGESVLLQGLSAGDQVITSRVGELHEGSAVAAAP